MRVIALALLVLLGSGCCIDLGGGGGSGGGGEGGGSGGGGADTLDAGVHFECAYKQLEQAEIDVLTTALTGPFTDGDSETWLDPTDAGTGCYRLVRKVTAGELTGVQVRRYSGELFYEVTPTGVTFGEKPDWMLIDWDGTTMKVDLDRDGFAEHTTVTEVTAAGLQRHEYTQFSASTKAVTRRITVTQGAGDSMHHKEELLVSGTLVPHEWDAPALQKQLGGNTCMLGTGGQVACSDVPAIKKKIDDAIVAGAKCMQGMDQILSEDFVKLMILRNQIASRADIVCFRDTGYVAAVDIKRPGGRIPFHVNADIATCGTNYEQSSLFHEAMHLLSGGHDDAILDAAFMAGNLLESEYTYFDRMRSCEAMCFGTRLKTQCACARCLQTKVCDQRCSRYGSCIERRDGGAVMSEAVGAVCRSGMGSLYKTMAACGSGCAGGTANCESKSLSCDPSCK